ncbi:hypothetical protein OEZ86_009762 [Tetradesmus obliquus]|uniref:Uncharacterized protein n=1 Tax=Tetradesmus obliquus TaxID=3088 RepID=A0ABY8UMY7_TETOB|nr:hypothetical protein OEZ85_001204 [Tetradesmus obliquus]WIA43259.1 hypothetical protein OEZ86_009762 [Tetradesmus obliquus]
MDPPFERPAKGMRKGFPVYGSRSCRGSRLVRELQQRVEQRTAELHDLTAQSNSLKQRQELLITSIGQQADELVALFKSLSFRMAFQLGLPESRAALLSGSLESTLHEYASINMLCHIVCPKTLWQAVTLNMETMEQALPGPDHWESVSSKMDPTEEQVSQLALGFEVYSRKRSAIIAELEQMVQQVHLMVWPQAGKEAAAAAAAATVAQVAAAAAPTPADLQQLPAPSFSSNCSSGTAANADGSSGSSELMAAAAGSSSSGGNESLARQQSLQSLLVNLEASEQLLQLLKDVDQRVQMLMTIECNLTFSWINTMDMRRMAIAVVESYPFMVMPIPLCELAAQQHVLMQEEAAAATAAKKGAAAKRQQSAD